MSHIQAFGSLVNRAFGGYFARCNETSLKVMFGSNAPRASKTAYRCRRCGSDPVRWRRTDQGIFSADWHAGRPFAPSALSPAKQPLQYQRVSGSVALSTRPGSGTHRDDRTAALQRCVSFPGGLAGLSRGHQLATLLAAVGLRWTKCLGPTARHVANDDDGTTGAGHLRSGQHGADGLRPSAASRGGLQPQETRASIVPSVAVFRRTEPRLLGGQLPAGQCAGRDHHHPAAGASLCQIAPAERAGSRACRWSVLRSQNPRLYRRKTGFLRDRRPAHPSAEKSSAGTVLPPRVAGGVGFGVSVLPAGMAGASTLRRHPPTGAGRTFGPVAPVPVGRLQLSGLRDQPGLEAAPPLALLQPAGTGRVDHPGIERRLCAGKDSHEGLPCQRGVLPDRPAGLQPAELVQAPLCPSPSATSHAATVTCPPCASRPATLSLRTFSQPCGAYAECDRPFKSPGLAACPPNKKSRGSSNSVIFHAGFRLR